MYRIINLGPHLTLGSACAGAKLIRFSNVNNLHTVYSTANTETDRERRNTVIIWGIYIAHSSFCIRETSLEL